MCRGDCHAHVVSGATVRQREQHHEAGLTFHKRGDRGQARLADDEVAFPVAGHRAVFHFRRALAE